MTLHHLGNSEQKIDVKVPPGIKDGGKIRLAGKGELGGDLYIKVKVHPHPIFRREEDDLYVDIPVFFTEAILGGSVKVPTMDGAVNLKIPSGTSSGKKFRIPGKGVPHMNGAGKGDQYVVVKIVVPPDIKSHLTSSEEDALRQIHEKMNGGPRQ